MVAKMAKDKRQKLLAKVHILKKQANLSDEQYRGILSKWAINSCKSATEKTLINICEYIDLLVKEKNKNKPTQWQKNYIKDLCIGMGWSDGMDSPQFKAFVKRTVNIDNVAWLTNRQASDVITGLINWQKYNKEKGE